MVPGAYLALFAGDTCISASEKHECHVLCKLHHDLIAVNHVVNHVNPNVHGIGQVEAGHWKYKRVKLGSGQTYNCSAD
jgi:hypothetical protein